MNRRDMEDALRYGERVCAGLTAERDRLAAEVERQKAHNRLLDATARSDRKWRETCQRAAHDARAKLARAVEALKRYGDHREDCFVRSMSYDTSMGSEAKNCTCRYSAALAEIGGDGG